jgi:hypothetical protein
MVAPGLDRCPVAASTSRSSCSGIIDKRKRLKTKNAGPLGADGLQQWRVGAYFCGASLGRAAVVSSPAT